jgi:hypothetical protein
MKLKGSCHCRAVRFSLESETPYPYLWCYCSICRKTAGGGGYAINLMGLAKTLKVTGSRNLAVYRPMQGKRYFCRKCGSALWVWDRRWKDWVYPFASAIDTGLPAPRERQHIFLESKPTWVEVPKGRRDKRFKRYPREAIIDWHRRRELRR